MATKQKMRTSQGMMLWFSLMTLMIVIVALIILSFHQQVVPSHTHDAHPQTVAQTALYWQDSERLKMDGPSYNYISPAFTAQTSSATLHWTCYPSPMSNVPSYTLNITVKGASGVEQTSLIACNEMTPTQGTSSLTLIPDSKYVVAITSNGPWTVDIEPNQA